jgi:SAM-dependent methyltransferase
LLVGSDGGVLLNSHWLQRGDWYGLPLADGAILDRVGPVLAELTPDGVVDGQIDSGAARLQEPDDFLQPVDDALVARLDHWRAEAMRFSDKPEGLDARLHSLFAQFFILRRVEDKGLAPSLVPLSSVLSSNAPLASLAALIAQARDVIGSELFNEAPITGVPETVVAGIVRDLYEPSHLPGHARYHFEWVDADVLGAAYEKYLANVLRSAPAPEQLRLFGGQPIREAARVSVRKEVGVYYTPHFLVEYLVERALDGIEVDQDPAHLPLAIDFSCGSGSFLVALVDALIRRLRRVDDSVNWGRALVASGRVVGVDIDERAVTLTRLALWIRFSEEPDPFPLPDLEDTVRQGDALDPATWGPLEDEYHIVLGNPPFVALPGESVVDIDRFRSARGRFDYSYLFVEMGLERLKPGGVLAMVVPNRLFRNRHARAIRDVVTSLAAIESVVDFGSLEVFRKTGAYVGAIVARRLKGAENGPPRTARVMSVKDLAGDRFLGARLLDADHASGGLTSPKIESFDARYPEGGEPWLFLSEGDVRDRLRLQDSGPRLDEVASIFQGIRTGANDVFVLEVVEDDQRSMLIARNGLGDTAALEIDILRPCVFGSDMRRNRMAESQRALVYPHQDGRPLSEEVLRSRFPKAHQYLSRYQEALGARSGIRDTSRSWFELVWPRDEEWLNTPKLLIRDLAPTPAFSIDAAGAVYNVGGTAVVPTESIDLFALTAYLNSSIVRDWLQPTAAGFRGGFYKFEPRHVSSIPVPRELLEDESLQAELASLVQPLLERDPESEDDVDIEDEIDRTLNRALQV